MSSWERYLGKHQAFKAKNFATDMGKAFYLATVKVKDGLVESCNYSGDDNPYHQYETFKMAQNPTKGERPTYRGMKTIKDKNSGATTEEEMDIFMKKWITITADIRLMLEYLVCAYFREARAYFVHCKMQFPEDNFLEGFVDYSRKNMIASVSPFIIGVSSLYDISNYIKSYYNGIEKSLTGKAEQVLVDGDDGISPMIGVLVQTFLKFLNMLAVKTSCHVFVNHKAVNYGFLAGCLYDFNTQLITSKMDISSETINLMGEYIKEQKPVKAKKEDGDEPKPRKTRAKAGAKSGAKTGARKAPAGKKGAAKSKSKKEESEEDDDDDNANELDDAEDNWEEGAVDD